MIDFEIRFGLAPVLRRNNGAAFILQVIPIVPATLYIFAVNKAVLAFLSKRISSMFISSSDHSYSQVLPDYITCGNAERLDSNDGTCGPLLVAEVAVRTSLLSSFSTLCSSVAQAEDACSARSLFVRALVAVLNMAR